MTDDARLVRDHGTSEKMLADAELDRVRREAKTRERASRWRVGESATAGRSGERQLGGAVYFGATR